MTADAAHVAAVVTERERHHTWWSFLAESFLCRGCDWRDDDPARRDEHLATVVVETLTPLIRAQIAAEIRDAANAAEDNPDDWDASYWIQALHSAARIAEGTP